MAVQAWQVSLLESGRSTPYSGETLNPKILVVDDENAVRTTLAALFVEFGYEVDCAHDGVSALEAILNRPPDLLISDLSMPGMTGLELLSIVSQRFPKIRRVAMSGTAPDWDLSEAVALDAFVEKGAGKTGDWLKLVQSLIGVGRARKSEFAEHPHSALMQYVPVRSSVEHGMPNLGRSTAISIDMVPACVFVLSPELTCEAANLRYLDLIGETYEAVEGEAWARFVHPHDRESLFAIAAASVALGESYQMDCRFLRSDGRHQWLQMHAEPFEDEEGRLRWCCLLHEIQNDRVSSIVSKLPPMLPAKDRTATLSALLVDGVVEPLTAMLLNAKAVSLRLQDERSDLGELRAIVERILREGRGAINVINEVRSFQSQFPQRRTEAQFAAS